MQSTTDSIESYLKVGQYAMLQADPWQKDGPRYVTSLLGWKKLQSILIEHPKLPEGREALIRDGQPCVVRFVQGGDACAFTSIVLGRTGKRSGGQVSLSWPDQIESQPLRRFERIRFEAPCKLVHADGAVTTGRLKDLSVGGCGVISGGMFEKDEAIQLQFTFPDGVQVSGLRARIRTVSVRREGKFAGCEFESGQAGLKNSINFFVGMELARRRSDSEPHPSAKRVMVVDSRPAFFEELNGTLSGEQIETYCTASAVDAMYALRSMSFHAVAVHFALPDLSGLELCRLVRGATGLEHLRLYLYGGSASEIEAVLKIRLDRWFPESPSMLIELASEVQQTLQSTFIAQAV